MKYITLALAKGRLAEKTIKLFNTTGLYDDPIELSSRKLVLTSDSMRIKIILAKASDVPTYVEYGVADMGIVGKDTLLEEKRNLYELVDLGFGGCRMVVAGPEEMRTSLEEKRKLRVGTKYPQLARDYFFDKRGQTVEIIKLHGSVELAAIVGLTDIIVDIVETGSTLKENGLVILEEICPISARMVVNRVSMKIKNQRIEALINLLKTGSEKYDTYN